MTDKNMDVFLSMSKEATAMLPDGMKEAAALAFQAVALSHGREYKKSLEKLRKLRALSFSREPYCDLLAAENEMKAAECLPGDTPERRRCLLRARMYLSSFLSSTDMHKKTEKEINKATMMKARVDYMLYRRKGIFMGIVELPENTEVKDMERAAKLRGMSVLDVSETSILMKHRDGGLFGASLEDPGLVVIAGLSNGMDYLETASVFIRIASSVMDHFSASSFYINGVMLEKSDVDEAIRDIMGDSFPVWFFARGSEENVDGALVLSAEGAESFGAKSIRIIGADSENKDEAANALSLILVYHVFSASARRSRSFTIGEHTYERVSSDKDSVTYIIK